LGKIKVAIAGLGSCASALIQGVEYYRNQKEGGVREEQSYQGEAFL